MNIENWISQQISWDAMWKKIMNIEKWPWISHRHVFGFIKFKRFYTYFFSSPQVVSSGCSVFPTHTRTHTGFKTQHPQKQNEGFCSAVWLLATTNPMFCYISYNLPTSCGSSDRSISKGWTELSGGKGGSSSKYGSRENVWGCTTFKHHQQQLLFVAAEHWVVVI